MNRTKEVGRTTDISSTIEMHVARRAYQKITSADGLAITILVAACLATSLLRAVYDDWISGYDGFNYFLPNWGYLGERLRQGEIPAWNPYYSSGTPFAGDPAGGWMYLPVMLLFGLLKPLVAWKSLIFLLQLICGGALYAFARVIGLTTLPSLFVSVGFVIGPIAYGLATDRVAFTTQYPSICVGLLATEMALRSRRRSSFLGWSALVGIALSQNIASWPAQGLLYTTMYLAGWVTYRCLVDPLACNGSRLLSIRKSVLLAIGVAGFTIGFAGASLWPALDFIGQTTLAGGDYLNSVGGVNLPREPLLEVSALLLQDSPGYRMTTQSGAVIILALCAIVLGRKNYAVPYFAITAWLFTDIASNESIALKFLYLVPMFERIHSHRPVVAAVYAFPALLLLGAAGIQILQEQTQFSKIVRTVAISGGAFSLFVAVCQWKNVDLGVWPITLAVITGGSILGGFRCIAVNKTIIGLPAGNVLAGGLIALLFVYPTGVDYGRVIFADRQIPGLEDVNPLTDDVDRVADATVKPSEPDTAAEFLQIQRDTQPPFRYASYYGADTPSGQHLPFLWRRLEPAIVSSLAGSRAGFLQLQQISGINPLHLRHYVEYFEFVNGKEQNYHFTDIFYQALDTSQLFAMLNVRYILVTTDLGFIPPIAHYGKEVYRDEIVIVYENPYAFPRAWIAHEVRPELDSTYLEQMNSYLIDGRNVAYVDGTLPDVSFPSSGMENDSAVITSYKPESITLQTSSQAPGLLVLSEVYTHGWNAYVDGEKVRVLRTDHALRGIPLPGGEHIVVVKFEPRELIVGIWSTGVTGVAMIGIWTWAAVDRGRQIRNTRLRETVRAVKPMDLSKGKLEER